jgi:outer membrane lipoprotein SlyB
MKIMTRILLLGALAIGLASLGGCASNIDSNARNTPKQVQQGLIVQIQSVESEPESGQNVVQHVGTVGGVTIAGTTGDASKSSLAEQSTLQYIVKLNDSGQIISVVQSVKEPLRPGNHVLVTSGGGQRTHLVLDSNYKS